ncbi:Uncharacterised protein [Mycobacteroides abscessus subsp. abscessus]|nr:Uncharacterised protein [Mycobacteroides abscessus subsp. abscessus]
MSVVCDSTRYSLGRNTCPATKGNSSCTTISSIAVGETVASPVVCISSITNTGVMKTPNMFETDALTTAAATLPRAIDVNAIEDCTVEGNRHRYSTPV